MKLHVFLSSDKRCEMPTPLGPVEVHNLNHWTAHVSITTAQ
jgi:hypothetical protein